MKIRSTAPSTVILCSTFTMLWAFAAANAADIGTAFTYQGSLENGDGPVTDTCDFRFRLYDASIGGNGRSAMLTFDGLGSNPLPISVDDGIFKVEMDFGTEGGNGPTSLWGTDALWMEIDVRCPTGVGPYIVLQPRIQLTPAPLALALPGLYTQQNATSPNLIGGFSGNLVMDGVIGATIAGGGAAGIVSPNIVRDDYGTISGGYGNRAGNDDGSTTSATSATVGGGGFNAAGATYATVAGGSNNFAGGRASTSGGGWNCDAFGEYATTPGGENNVAGGDYSFAAGRRAKVRSDNSSSPYYSGDTDGDEGTFIWADSTNADFVSTGPNQFLIRAGGGVGIGTNAPGSQLDVAGEVRSTGATGGQLTAYNPNNQGASVHLSWFDDVARIRVGGTGTGNANGLDIQRGGDNSLMRILNNGNVGIGTTAPETRLHLAGGSDASLGGGGFVTLGSTTGVNIAIDNNELMARNNGAASPLALNTDGGNVHLIPFGIGNVGIGTDEPSAKLHVVGDIVYTGTITDISDERLKDNIAPVQNAITKIQKLRGVYFNMTDTPDQRDVGLIAQDVLAVLPEAVRVVDPEKGYLGVAYPSVIPLLVEAIKEQDTAIAAKECEIESLGSEVSNLKYEIDELKSLVKALVDRHSQGEEK